MAMMGSASAEGADRARLAAEAAVKSPLLEDVNLQGARGVLVNVTASASLKMREYHAVMSTIREFMAEDALVIDVVAVVGEFAPKEKAEDQATGEAQRQARHIQRRIQFFARQQAQRGFQIAFHAPGRCSPSTRPSSMRTRRSA